MRKLSKIKSEAKISGVCAGLARYFGLDVTIIRVLWVLAVFFAVGSPVLVYIIMAIVMPDDDPDAVPYEDVKDEYDDSERY